MERLTNSDKEIPTLSDNAEYWLKAYFKLKDYEDLEELIGVSLKDLTKIFNDHIPEDCKNPKKTIVLTDDDVDKWNDYKNAEEQGLLLRLPCKVGDMVYLICSRYSECSKYKERLDEYNCQGCEEDECDSHKEYYIHINHSVSIEWIVRNLNNFGKTVFLTQAEAEQKLNEMEGSHEGY